MNLRLVKNTAIAVVFAVCAARAQSTWGVGGGDWGAPSNWGGTLPASATTTDITFNGAGGASVNNLADPFSLRRLTFAAGSGAYTFSGGALKLHEHLQNNSLETQVFNNDILVGAYSEWTLAGDAVCNGSLESDGGNLQKRGAGELLLTRDATLSTANPFIENGRVRVSGPAARLTMNANQDMFNSADATKSFTLENGARLDARGFNLQKYGTILVTGEGTVWTNGNSNLQAGYTSFTVTDGAEVANVGNLRFESGGHNTVAITDGAKVQANWLQFGDDENTLEISGAKHGAPALLRVMDGAEFSIGTPNNNTLTVGTGGLLQLNSLFVGTKGARNGLVVADGGRVGRMNGNANDNSLGDSDGNTANNRIEVRGRDPATLEPSLFNLNNGNLIIDANNPQISSGQTSQAAGAYTNNMLLVCDGAAATNLNAVYMGRPHQTRIARDTYCKLIASNGGKVYMRQLSVGDQASANLALVEGAGSLFDLGGGTLNIGASRNACRNQLVIDAGVVTNVNNVYICRNNGDVGAFVMAENSLIVQNGGSLTSRGQCHIAALANNNPLTNANNSVLVTGAGSVWNHIGGQWDAMCIGFVDNRPDAVAIGNSVKVEHGGLIRQVCGIEVGCYLAGARGNSLILGPGGRVETPYVRVGHQNGAVGNHIVFGGGVLAAGNLEIKAGNGVIAEVSAEPFEPSVFTSVTIEDDMLVTPVAAGGNLGNRVCALIHADAITGWKNIRLDPAADAGQWKLIVTETDVTLLKIEMATLFMVR